MLSIVWQTQFKKDFKIAKKREKKGRGHIPIYSENSRFKKNFK